jgi:hypothetical protein
MSAIRKHLVKNPVWDSSCLMELRAVVRFFMLKELPVEDMRAELKGLSGNEALPLSATKKWRKRFANGRINFEDDPKSGRPP